MMKKIDLKILLNNKNNTCEKRDESNEPFAKRGIPKLTSRFVRSL